MTFPRAPVERLIHERQIRAAYIDADLLGEPGWDIMLGLARTEALGSMVSITGTCSFANVSETTALRYLGLLVDRGLAVRIPDPHDRRRGWVELSARGRDRMFGYVREIAA